MADEIIAVSKDAVDEAIEETTSEEVAEIAEIVDEAVAEAAVAMETSAETKSELQAHKTEDEKKIEWLTSQITTLQESQNRLSESLTKLTELQAAKELAQTEAATALTESLSTPLPTEAMTETVPIVEVTESNEGNVADQKEAKTEAEIPPATRKRKIRFL